MKSINDTGIKELFKLNKMTPKEKANELVDKFSFSCIECDYDWKAKQCALIAVDELIKSCPLEPTDVDWDDAGGTHQYWYESRQDEAIKFWQEVKQEIEKL